MNPFSPQQVDALLRAAGPGAIVHLVGAGGCGMSGLGHILLDLGFHVTGSDLLVNEEIRDLRSRGADIQSGHAAERVQPRTVLVVHTSAVGAMNPELREAEKRGIPAVRRAVLLAALLHRQRGICVAGMHGKTTTAALLSFALSDLGAAPSYAVGALVPQLSPHARMRVASRDATVPENRWFVIEADESDGTLKQFHPEHAIVLNVDADHLDHFSGIEAIIAEFRQFSDQTSGRIVFCADDARLAELFSRNRRAVSYGRHPLAVYRAEPLAVESSPSPDEAVCPGDSIGGSRFQVWRQGEPLGIFATSLLGEQNISNATAAIALLHELGYPAQSIAQAIAGFGGAARRQQLLYGDEECRIFEDYGHHPNEIRATLRALKSLAPKRLLVAFQPHRFTRTQHLWKEFALCFDDADMLWLVDLYPASEPEIPGINSGFLANAIRAHGQTVEAVVSLPHLAGAIRDAIRPGDLAVFLGAGDITRIAHDLADQLRAARSQVRSASSPVASFAAGPDSEGTVLMNSDLCAQLAARVSPATAVREKEPLARRTTLRVGGMADLYSEPSSEADLAEILRFCADHALPVFVLGRGSNLLIRDGGIRGMVVCLAHPHFSEVQISGEAVRCGAGARLKAVAVEAKRHGLSGLEFLEGIPGSLGGAMRMNAGAMGSWLFDVVKMIRFMDYTGALHERAAAEVNVEYRGCPLFKDHIALAAELKGQPARKEAIQERMDLFSRRRWESQPSQPSAGCIFKNPTTIPAGRLIDELGLKGTRVGGATVSDVHGNFIVNDGTATARDVLNLIEIIKERAKSARGIALETEVQILGEG